MGEPLSIGIEGQLALRARWPWWTVPLALLIPAAIFALGLTSPLHMQDDHLIFQLTGRTGELSAPLSYGQHIRIDMENRGRFRPLWCVSYLWMAQAIGPRPAILHLWPYSLLLVSTLLLLAVGRSLGMSGWLSIVLAWLVVLNPRGREVWYMLAPSEKIALVLSLVAVLAIIRGTLARRRWAWDGLAVLTAGGAGCAKESFVLAIPALMVMRLSLDLLLAGRPWRQALTRNVAFFLALAAVLAVDLVFIRLAFQSKAYSQALMEGVPLGKGIARVLKHGWDSNVFLIPVGVFMAAYFARGWFRDARIRNGLLAMLAITLVWLLPTAGLQAKIGGAPGRWIFPLTLSLTFANAMAFAFVYGRARPEHRRILNLAILVWFAWCGLKSFAGLSEFLASARVMQTTVAAIDRTVPPEGRVLIAADTVKQVEMAQSLQRYLAGTGRGDIRVDVLDVPAGPRSPSQQAAVARYGREYFHFVTDPDLSAYDALVGAPPTKPLPRPVADRLPPDLRRAELSEPYYPLRPGSPWRETFEASLYLRQR